ncbi:28S ribosomal protein S14, mitochondrial [Leptopilina heterotoma]|uniref:28S ribosomal protein S14, mitochondrial n=1 Tax=Leptopilina heterotoma TaxID=63436 RepID=UPI001CA83E3C|nr:28S ribosomal protein S14, mitochondrial [Leptopilina heterotoma]
MFFSLGVSSVSKLLFETPQLVGNGVQQVRNYWSKALTRRDMKRRKLAKEFAPTRLRLVCIKRCKLLPQEIRDCASKDFDFVPRQSALRQLTGRCVVTSRPRGNLMRWRLSRFIFRDAADHNQLSGVQRAMW